MNGRDVHSPYFLFGEEAADAGVIGDHAVIAFFPIHGADFAVGFEMLEGIDDAEALADGAAERHVIDDLMADDAFAVDEEESAVGDELAFDDELAVFIRVIIAGEDVVVFGNGFVDIGDERVFHALDAAFVLRRLEPGPVGEFRVGGAADDGDIAFFEFGKFFLEAMKFGRADEGEILRIEEEHDVFFPDELIERKVIDDGFAFDGFCAEGGGWFANENGHGGDS